MDAPSKKNTSGGTAASLNAGSVFLIARDAYARIDDTLPETKGGQNDAIVAIVFSAAALEAFLSQLAYTAGETNSILFPGCHRIELLAVVLREMEEAHASADKEYSVAKMILTGEQFDKSHALFRDLRALFRLRNAIVHMKPDVHKLGRERRILEWLPKNILDFDPQVMTSLLYAVGTRAAARWACNVVPSVVEELFRGFDWSETPYGEDCSAILFHKFPRIC